jgi:hypothetical protein
MALVYGIGSALIFRFLDTGCWVFDGLGCWLYGIMSDGPGSGICNLWMLFQNDIFFSLLHDPYTTLRSFRIRM